MLATVAEVVATGAIDGRARKTSTVTEKPPLSGRPRVRTSGPGETGPVVEAPVPWDPQRVAGHVSGPSPLTGSPDSPVGGRLQQYWREWKILFPESSAYLTIKKGARWTFLSPPPLQASPAQFPTSREQEVLLLQAADSLVQKGAVERLPAPVTSPGFYSRLFLRPKPTGELRPIIDLSRLNDLILCKSFKMETASSIQEALQPGEWMFQVDIKDAYLHIPVRKELRKYLRFTVANQVFQFKTLPFGLCTAPRTFTLILVPVLALLRARGIKVHAYLDDWLGRSRTQMLANTHGEMVTSLLTRLGWLVNWEKSFLEGSQVTIFLGLLFDLCVPCVKPGPKGIMALHSVIRALHPGEKITARRAFKLLGMLKHWAPYLRRGRLELRKVQRWLSLRWQQSRGRWSDLIRVDHSLCSILRWFLDLRVIGLGVPLHPSPPSQEMYTDASKEGWGGQLKSFTARGIWTPREKLLHINHLEMLAVLRACKEFRLQLQHRVTTAHIDNTTVVAYLKKEGGTRSWPLTLLTRQVLSWLDAHDITLRPVHIAGVLNVQADSLSRALVAQTNEWSISLAEFRRITHLLGTPYMDLMATGENRVVDRFISPCPHPEAWAVDCLKADWPKYSLLYLFPPPCLVTKVIHKIRTQEEVHLILIASTSPLRPYHPDLLELATGPPTPICRTIGSLWQIVPGLPGIQLHKRPELFQLGVWHIRC